MEHKPPSSTEAEKFRHVLLHISNGGKVEVPCLSSSRARSLRRRFYYLKSLLPAIDSLSSVNVQFQVKGRLVIAIQKDVKVTEWSPQLLGDPNVPPSSSEPTPSN